ncbi:MAG: hypothetical protein PGN13_10910 [Patulibacter minatonensis]
MTAPRERRGGWRLAALAAALGGGALLAIVSVLFALLAWATKDFDDAGTPPEPPTSARLSAFERGADAHTYWLGRRFFGQRLTNLSWSRREPGAGLDYGEPGCEPGSGCSWELSVGGGTDRRGLGNGFEAPPPGGWRTCWRRLGRVWVVCCDDFTPGHPTADTSVTVLTADRAIDVESLGGDTLGGDQAFTVAKQLRRVRDDAPITSGTPPERLTCADLAPGLGGTPRAFARAVPAELRPAERCR